MVRRPHTVDGTCQRGPERAVARPRKLDGRPVRQRSRPGANPDRRFNVKVSSQKLEASLPNARAGSHRYDRAPLRRVDIEKSTLGALFEERLARSCRLAAPRAPARDHSARARAHAAPRPCPLPYLHQVDVQRKSAGMRGAQALVSMLHRDEHAAEAVRMALHPALVPGWARGAARLGRLALPARRLDAARAMPALVQAACELRLPESPSSALRLAPRACAARLFSCSASLIRSFKKAAARANHTRLLAHARLTTRGGPPLTRDRCCGPCVVSGVHSLRSLPSASVELAAALGEAEHPRRASRRAERHHR